GHQRRWREILCCTEGHYAPAALALAALVFSAGSATECTRWRRPCSARRARRSAKSPAKENSAEPFCQLTRSSQSSCEGKAVTTLISSAGMTTTGRSSGSRAQTRVRVRYKLIAYGGVS